MIVRIYNLVLNKEILFPSIPEIIIHPKEYDDKPHVEIIINDFNFIRHAKSCEDCGAFLNDFTNNSLNWYVAYNNRKYRLDMNGIGKQFNNSLVYSVNNFETGTRMKLYFSNVPQGIEKLKEFEQDLVKEEKYEFACNIRDLIKIES